MKREQTTLTGGRGEGGSFGAGAPLEHLEEGGAVGGAGEERRPERGGQRRERRRPGLERLEQPAEAQVERGVVAAVAVEGALGADGAGLEQHPRGLGVAREAGVVERDGVPAVARVDIGAGLEEEGEAVAVPRPRRLEEVAAGDLLEGHRRLEVLRIEFDVDVEATELDVRIRVHGCRNWRRGGRRRGGTVGEEPTEPGARKISADGTREGRRRRTDFEFFTIAIVKD